MAEQVAEYLMSAAEYLAWESAQPFKNELIFNRIYPMPGGSRAHENIIAALVSLFFTLLRDTEGDVYAGGMQVQVDSAATYTYPDVTVVYGTPRFRRGKKPNLLQNPTLLFEVLSPSTESIDRNEKREQYLNIPSLLGYYLVAQDKAFIEAYTRAGEAWVYSQYAGRDASICIPAPERALPLREIYRRLPFASA